MWYCNVCFSLVDENVETEELQEEEAKSQVSERELLEALTEQAREIAKKVLGDNPDAGIDLAADAKVLHSA